MGSSQLAVHAWLSLGAEIWDSNDVHSVLAGGSGDGSPQLQHELIIPQWKTAESPVREKVRLKESHFHRQDLTAPFFEA